jgi:sialate O-acetylesterase
VVALDLGEPTVLHPLNKQDVGSRLAAHAVYQHSGAASGPLFARVARRGSTLRVNFRSVHGRLRAGGPLTAVTVAGADRKLHPAEARLDGNSPLVSAADVSEPVAVRYAWANCPPAPYLSDDSNLPAAPFRSDAW